MGEGEGVGLGWVGLRLRLRLRFGHLARVQVVFRLGTAGRSGQGPLTVRELELDAQISRYRCQRAPVVEFDLA